MELLTHREAARRLGVDHEQIGYWCNPRDGLVHLEAHPLISPAEFEELPWIADRRNSGISLQNLRIAIERRRAQEDVMKSFIHASGVVLPITATADEMLATIKQNYRELTTLRAKMRLLALDGDESAEALYLRREAELRSPAPAEGASTRSVGAAASTAGAGEPVLETTYGERLVRLHGEFPRRQELDGKPAIPFQRWLELSRDEHATLIQNWESEIRPGTEERRRASVRGDEVDQAQDREHLPPLRHRGGGRPRGGGDETFDWPKANYVCQGFPTGHHSSSWIAARSATTAFFADS